MRRLQRVTGPDKLEWTVRRLIVPNGMRPMSRTDILDAATPRRTSVDGVSGSVPDASVGVTGPLPLGALFSLVLLPLVPLVLVLRYARLVRWTVEARAYPWGRRYPPVVLAYAIRGHEEASGAVDDLAEALARGDGAPTLPGAEFIPQRGLWHDGTSNRTTFDHDQARVYRHGRR
jgi:hypothetical protein